MRNDDHADARGQVLAQETKPKDFQGIKNTRHLNKKRLRITLGHLDGDFVLSMADVLDEDNRDALEVIAKRSSKRINELLPIRFETEADLDYLGKSNVLHIPVAD